MLLIVHGGAGHRRPSRRSLQKIKESLRAGYGVLTAKKSALDAVVEAVSVLEDSGMFNAGSGGNLQFDGIRRLDASVMEGEGLRTGSVIGVEDVRNPVRLARIIMDSPHVMMTGVGAKKIAEINGLDALPQPDQRSLRRLEEAKRKEKEMTRIYTRYFSTVGAVAMDASGTLASCSSTGGVRAMLPGRVGDTPVIGAGIYADNALGAVSCTGLGEAIIRICLAKEICLNLKAMTPRAASRSSLKRLIRVGGLAGVIAVNNKKQFAISHTTRYMASGYLGSGGPVVSEGFMRISVGEGVQGHPPAK